MSTRQTSIQAYRAIKANGLLGKRQSQVYDVLFHHGPLTSMEIGERIPDALLNSTSPRLAELRDRGVVMGVGEKKCQHTKQTVTLWDVTPNMPTVKSKKKSKAAERKDLVELAYDILSKVKKGKSKRVDDFVERAKKVF